MLSKTRHPQRFHSHPVSSTPAGVFSFARSATVPIDQLAFLGCMDGGSVHQGPWLARTSSAMIQPDSTPSSPTVMEKSVRSPFTRRVSLRGSIEGGLVMTGMIRSQSDLSSATNTPPHDLKRKNSHEWAYQMASAHEKHEIDYQRASTNKATASLISKMEVSHRAF